MKKLILVGAIIVCHLVIYAAGQNCPFAVKALQSSKSMDQARQAYLNELRPSDYDLYITPGQPGYEMWAETAVAQPFWDDFRRARIELTATETINHKMFFDRECNDLSPYTNCFTNSPLDICYDKTGLLCDANARYRTLGGTCNNLPNPRPGLQNPKLGAQYSAYSRLIAPEYHDCIHSERRTAIDSIELPSPRIIGNILADNGYGVQDRPAISVLNVFGSFAGQLVTHDTGSRINVQRNSVSGPGIQCCSQYYTRRLSEDISHPACKPIDIPVNDPFYSRFQATCMNFISSQTTFSNDCKVGPAQQSNSVSSFMDLTIIYGDDLATQNQLRSRQQGQMITNYADVLPVTPNCRQQPCYFLGDVRVVQTPMLAQWHSLFLRLHNFIAPQLSSVDETAYQEAKRLTTALYQRIIYNEWLPIILGDKECSTRQLSCDPCKVGSCGKYDPYTDPSNTNDFTHGAFRWLHAYIPSTINFYGPDNRILMSRALSDMNSSYVNILDTNYDNLLRGVLNDPVNFGGYSPELRNRLFKDANGMGVDLFSIDIKRARDHGVAPYHAYISSCTNTQVTINAWPDLNPYFTPESIAILQKIYKSPRDIDLLVGVLGERRLTPFTLLGKIGSCIVAEQFRRFKFGDRFFYQWNDGPNPFTPDQLKEIERFSMATFLCTVTNLGYVPPNAFWTPIKPNLMQSCSTIPKFNFALFRK